MTPLFLFAMFFVLFSFHMIRFLVSICSTQINKSGRLCQSRVPLGTISLNNRFQLRAHNDLLFELLRGFAAQAHSFCEWQFISCSTPHHQSAGLNAASAEVAGKGAVCSTIPGTCESLGSTLKDDAPLPAEWLLLHDEKVTPLMEANSELPELNAKVGAIVVVSGVNSLQQRPAGCAAILVRRPGSDGDVWDRYCSGGSSLS